MADLGTIPVKLFAQYGTGDMHHIGTLNLDVEAEYDEAAQAWTIKPGSIAEQVKNVTVTETIGQYVRATRTEY